MPKAKRRTLQEKAEEIGLRLRKLPLYKSKLYMAKEARIKEALKAYEGPAGPRAPPPQLSCQRELTNEHE